MIGNGVEMSSLLHQILGPLVLGWAPNHFVLGAQLAPGEKRLVCIPDNTTPYIRLRFDSGIGPRFSDC